jgi:2-oxoisovalerate dehydrogenase E1 component
MSLGYLYKQPTPENVPSPLQRGRDGAERGIRLAQAYLADPDNHAEIACALRISAVENALYELFGRGKLHGTIHTCIGQEFSAAILRKHLRPMDFVTSNHRCHGHFIAATGDWRGLIDELVGNEAGVCAGIGSSQHLWAPNFISNGQQGGLLPVAAGVALDRKSRERGSDDREGDREGGVVVSFVGEGTLGEGIVYETLNLDALWQLPHVIVCENNFYSQSTPQALSVAGEIAERASAFGVTSVHADIWDLASLDAAMGECIARARATCRPAFLTLATYRLNPHSKGDDLRDKAEIAWFRERDPVTLAIRDHPRFRELYDGYVAEAAEHIAAALTRPALDPATYVIDQLPRVAAGDVARWSVLDAPAADGARVAQQLNAFYGDWLRGDESAFFIGEDIEDPYGGAFKIAKGLTTEFAPRARTSPISEAAITGIGVGLAITGRRAFIEIMFGDFITYAFDQIINNASKFFHIYNQNLECPVIVRTPMGGRRGYGPTHSQSLERFLVGIDNVCTISLHSLAPVDEQLAGLRRLRCPVILLENKSDYTMVTLVAYGGMARFVASELIEIFERTDEVPELLVPVGISPLNLVPILESVRRSGRLVIIEEGGGFGSVGAELIAQLHEVGAGSFAVARVSGKPVPVPSAPSLEAAMLPSIDEVCDAIGRVAGRR